MRFIVMFVFVFGRHYTRKSVSALSSLPHRTQGSRPAPSPVARFWPDSPAGLVSPAPAHVLVVSLTSNHDEKLARLSMDSHVEASALDGSLAEHFNKIHTA